MEFMTMRIRRLPMLALAATAIAPALAQTEAEVVLHNFAGPPKGAYPYAGVIRDSAGNLYGTTNSGGAANAGVVYRVDAAGHQTVLYSFTGGADGASPQASVIRDSSGNLYGTTVGGGTAGSGVVFKLDTTGRESVLHSFTGYPDGAGPTAGAVLDSVGNLYGTTSEGGLAGAGVVYKVDTSGHETVLHSFTGGADGREPYAGVILDSAGNLYGTTVGGGVGSAGVVYKLDSAGVCTTLYSFSNFPDGANPYGGVIQDASGNLYGTTHGGGTADSGTVYELDTSGHETVLYSFRSLSGADGYYPNAGLSRDSAGNLYGTALAGGTAGAGAVYKLDPAGQETVLYNFPGGSGGASPYAGVILASAGTLYGTTPTGGTGNVGQIFKLDAAGHETVAYSFAGYTDGAEPYAGVIGDSAGNLYGTTSGGGASAAGTVYKVDTAGHETVLYSFTGGTDGSSPVAGVIRDSAGNLYGTTIGGGAAGWGVVYTVDTTGHQTVLYSFTGGLDGARPDAGVVRDAAGNLYGTASQGGSANAGVVYKLDTAGHQTVLYSFTGYPDGAYPNAGLIRDTAGNLFGTTTGGGKQDAGTVFEVDSASQEMILYSFTGGADGGEPASGVIRDSAGNFYGTTPHGGTPGAGVVYKLDTTGHETVLYSFTGGADGGNPSAGVTRDSPGNLYGTAYYGGAANVGIVYKLDTTGQQTVLHSFTGGADGGFPLAGVIRDAAGNLYGTAIDGGKKYAGVLFKIKP
jgi:uncharacterized repeat protein (TIGR03803 family)